MRASRACHVVSLESLLLGLPNAELDLNIVLAGGVFTTAIHLSCLHSDLFRNGEFTIIIAVINLNVPETIFGGEEFELARVPEVLASHICLLPIGLVLERQLLTTWSGDVAGSQLCHTKLIDLLDRKLNRCALHHGGESIGRADVLPMAEHAVGTWDDVRLVRSDETVPFVFPVICASSSVTLAGIHFEASWHIANFGFSLAFPCFWCLHPSTASVLVFQPWLLHRETLALRSETHVDLVVVVTKGEIGRAHV